MTAKIMSSFAAGLIVAASVCGAVYFFGTSEGKSAQAIEKFSQEEMKETLITSGYVVLNKEEWSEKLTSVEQDWKEKLETVEAEWQKKLEDRESTDVSKSEEQKEQIAYRTIINVASGMTSIDVGRALVNAKIIDNPLTFVNEVEKRGLANDLQPGSYEVDSGMTMDQAISVIFK